jgi:hypothetical protein
MSNLKKESNLKIWIGPELEGYEKGQLTLFVKGDRPHTNYVVSLLAEHRECKRIYLGSGRTDVVEFSDNLLHYCYENGISVVVETSPPGIKNIPCTYRELCRIIVRVDIPDYEDVNYPGQTYLKLDTERVVRIIQSSEMIHTDLADLEGDMFKQDKFLFEIKDNLVVGEDLT